MKKGIKMYVWLLATNLFISETAVRITNGGMTAAIQLMEAPTIPATLYPAKAERLIAIAPGVDCATAAILTKSSSLKQCFLATKKRRTIGTTI